MIWNPPPDPKQFGHNFIYKKIRLMRKKSLVRLKNVRIFYPSPRLKMSGENEKESRFGGANHFYVSYGFAFLFCMFFRYHTTLHKLIFFWGGGKQRLKSFQMPLKSKIHLQKSKNVRIFYPLPTLKMLKKCVEFTYSCVVCCSYPPNDFQ